MGGGALTIRPNQRRGTVRMRYVLVLAFDN